MPTYEFWCSDCEAEVEIFQRMAEATPLGSVNNEEPCEKCGNLSLRRVIRTAPPMRIADGDGIYEQNWFDNGDGTLTVEPAAKNLRDGHKKIIPKQPKPYNPP